MAAEAEAQAGDQIEVAARHGEIAPSHGFLRVDTKDGIFVASDASGIGVRTRRFGVEDAFVVHRSPWSAFKHDQFVLFAAFLLPLLVPVILDKFQTTRERRLAKGADGSSGSRVKPSG